MFFSKFCRELSWPQPHREPVVHLQGEAQGVPLDQHHCPLGRDQEDLDPGDPPGPLPDSRQINAKQTEGSCEGRWRPYQVLIGVFSAPTPPVLLLYAFYQKIYTTSGFICLKTCLKQAYHLVICSRRCTYR